MLGCMSDILLKDKNFIPDDVDDYMRVQRLYTGA